MSGGFISRGFRGRRQKDELSGRIPPGQYLERGFPVLSAGPTPRVSLATWDFSIVGKVDQAKRWSWDEFRALPHEDITKDIHCVTKWSKLDTRWEGVSVDTLLGQVKYDAKYLVAFSDGGYTTNLPVEEVLGGKAWVVYGYDGQPLAPEHGGPVRLLVPHLYFWKSAKWVRGLRLVDQDEPGFWESLGYNNHGDP
jgi:DMSO/TMAO reductase YedYZ molybdopterin-dependent catalytic subunit